MEAEKMLTLEAFEEASETVSRVTAETKLISSDYFSSLCGNKVYLKPENMQKTGAYKLRGAYYKISTLSEEERARGLITASAGNHAQGVAYAAKAFGCRAVIVMPTTTPLIKVNRTKSYGAEVVLYGDVYDESCAYALSLAEEKGYTFIHPFDDPAVATGQGTIAMEIIKELPLVDYILVPVGGGGLCTGVSTLAKLLVHYYDLNGGRITLGGQDITDMSIEALNDNISYVSQEQFLFNTTLYENILIGKPDATREEVMAAAEKAQCGEFLKRLPDGIDTMAGDGGKQLSGGERQRISLARAILKNAPVIVLDEATAFIDPENEEKMNAAIAEIIKGKTVLVIAHRLQTVVNADKICVMKDGNIIAADTHDKLLESCEEYQKLWNSSEARANWKIGVSV
jgi:ABC-type cobalamin/Fe3+-siderophores transport system ATPase subunit